MDKQLHPRPEVVSTSTHDFVPTASGLLHCTRCSAYYRPEPKTNFAWPVEGGSASPCPGVEFVEYACLSMWQPWGSLVAAGVKTIETRVWATSFRGDLLFVAAQKRDPLLWVPDKPKFQTVRTYPEAQAPLGVALCLVTVTDCRPMRPGDEVAACCPYDPGKYAWVLENPRKVKPVPVKGAQRIFRQQLPKLKFT